MKRIPVVSKDLKVINDINQVLKKIFLQYSVYANGMALSLPGDLVGGGGFHFSILPNVESLRKIFQIEDETIIYFNAVSVFTAIKDEKKNIKFIFIDETWDVYFELEDGKKILIGKLTSPNDKSELHRRYEVAKTRLIDFDNESALDEETVVTLEKNGFIIFQQGEYKVRLTKQVIPNIKKDVPVHIVFSDALEKELFDVTIHTIKNDIQSYHIYKCFYY